MQTPDAIGELLARYVPAPGEQAALTAMRDLLGAGPPAWSATHFSPGHFTASAYVTDPEVTRVLLVFHERLGRWLQPGGHFEPDDATPLNAACREVAEETGVAPSGGPLVKIDAHAIPPAGSTPAHVHFDLTFHLSAYPGQVTPGTGVSDARWVPLGEVAALSSDASLLAGLRRLVAR